MKKGLFLKIFIGIIFIIIFNFFISMLLNHIYMNRYYVKERIQKMIEIMDKVKKERLSKEEIENIEEENNVKVFFIKLDIDNEDIRLRRRMRRFYQVITPDKMEEIKNGKTVISEDIHGIFGTIDIISYHKDAFVIISVSKTAIKENVKLSKKFYILAGIISLFIGFIIAYILAKKIVKPIKDINEVTKSMANLSFDKKCNINTGDEIEELAKNINYLSHSLESNLQNLKVANEKLKEDIEKEKKLDTEKEEFIASVSHELKTPIALINTYVESIAEDLVEEKDKEYYYKVITEEGMKLSELLDSLLRYLEKRTVKENVKENINLENILIEETQKYEIEANRKNVKMLNEFDIEKKHFYIEEENFKTVINNFLSNAVRNVEENGIIKVKSFEKKNNIIIEVYNSGSHIEEKDIENIWKPFYRIDKARNRKYGGTGLGLAIVRKILENQNNEYGVINNEKGVTFWFEVSDLK